MKYKPKHNIIKNTEAVILKVTQSFVMLCLMSVSQLTANEGDSLKSTLTEVQQQQFEYDSKFFEINMGFEKLRHIVLHLMKTVGKAAAYCEVKEHGKVDPDPELLMAEVAPDLLMHALQIANLFGVELGEKYQERIESNIKRIQSQSTHTSSQ